MKHALALGAAALLAAGLATPADARHRHRDRVDVDAGDVIATAIVAGGLLALASSASKQERRARQDHAVGACSEEAEIRSRSYVSDIHHVSKRKGYYTVSGALEADGGAERAGFTCTVRNGRIYRLSIDGNPAFGS